ncbi:uncharacterized protein LOC106156341 [Lingula anatina]|uniref:Uncharacterized protein LOC106156341 n=1 Tax=Lingula anatina TaxID=7574 RepID=A0A1S3HPN5_LINAN|nr:uncharacterized protein LOC106156341 [Lingula anatina]|eukprot:XP_013386999.1 uncharacterized protein LOC106156341 [Lingula anatina]
MKKCKLPCTDTGGKVSDDEESIFRILGKEKKPRVKRDDDGDGDEDNNKEKENDGGGDGENKNEDYFLNEGKEKEKVNALADEEENPPDKTTTTLNTKSTIKEVPTTKESPVIKNISKSADILAKGSSKYKPLPSKEPHTAWSEWTKCSASCDGGTRTRTRSCLKRKFPCKGEIRDFQFCNTMACPVEGDWSEWLGWNPCSVTCGTGHRTRYRKCDSPLPLLGGTCVGDDHQRKKCTMPECSKDISSTWTKWSKWTECSKTCGPSKKSRSRKCSTNSGEKSHVCVEASTQTVPCHPRPCPVKGQWAAWSSWAKCSRKCDIGVRIRDRTCTDPAPVGTGKRCIGLGADLSHCFRRPCGDPGELALVFKGEGFLQYPPNDIVSHVLYSFIRFNPSSGEGVLLHGHSANCTSDKCADSFELSLKDGVLCLKVDMVGQKMKLLSKEKLKTGVWHNVLISLIGKRGMMEVDDREQISAKFNVDLEMIDYDLPLTLGGVAPDSQSKTQGFEGKIADLRVNYKKFSLSRDRHWHGYGNPDKKANVKKTKADVEAVYPSFNGSSYLPLSSAPNGTHFQLSLVMKPVNLTGLIAFVPGMVSGSYASVMIRKGKLELCINLKVDRTCRKSGIELKVNSWYFVDINIAGNTAKFHINGNEANQLTVQGQPFTIRGKVYIGGGSNTDWTVFTAAGKVNSGFVGIIEQIILNGRVYSMKRRLLRGRYGHFNGVGASVAVHYNELFENEETVIDLRCDYTEMVLKAKKNEHVHVEWLRGNQKLVLNDHMTLLEEPGFGNVSVLRLRPSHTDANTGIYACLVTFRNTATILRSFGVTYHPYEMVMSFSAELPQISVIVVSVLLAVLALVLFMLQRLGYMRQITRKFNFYGKLAERANKRKKSDAKYERLDGPKAEEEETLDQKAKSSKTSVKSRSKQSVTGSVPGSKKSVKINLTGPSSDSLGASKESLMSKGSKKSIKGDSRSSIKQMSSHRSLASVHQRSGASLSSRSRASVESTVKKEDEISELCDPVLGSASSVASKLREEAEREFSEHLLKSQTNSVVSLKDSVATIGSMTQKGSTISVPSVASVASKKTSGDLSVEKHSSHSVRSTPSKAKES